MANLNITGDEYNRATAAIGSYLRYIGTSITPDTVLRCLVAYTTASMTGKVPDWKKSMPDAVKSDVTKILRIQSGNSLAVTTIWHVMDAMAGLFEGHSSEISARIAQAASLSKQADTQNDKLKQEYDPSSVGSAVKRVGKAVGTVIVDGVKGVAEGFGVPPIVVYGGTALIVGGTAYYAYKQFSPRAAR